jgi:hypothetical protein
MFWLPARRREDGAGEFFPLSGTGEEYQSRGVYGFGIQYHPQVRHAQHEMW